MIARVRELWERLLRPDMIRNAAALYGTTVVTSVLGFAFWVLADRFFAIDDVGRASAAISAMQLLSEFGLLGMTTLIIAELAREAPPVGLVSASALVAGVASGLLALGYVLLQHVVSTHLGPLGHGLVGPAIFIVGVGINATAYVLDFATVAIGRGGMQLWRNGVFAGVKLLLLLPSTLLTVFPQSELIYLSWLAGTLVSLVSFWFHLRRVGILPRLRPNVSALVATRMAALAHHWLNLAAQVSRLVLPVLVAATMSAKLTAIFYTITVVVSFVGIISTHLSTALFALPRGDYDRLARELRRALRLGLVIAGAGAIVFILFGHPILSIFGHTFAEQATTIALFGLSPIPYTIKSLYMAVERVHGRLTLCAAISTLGGVLEVAGAYVGSRSFGLAGVAGGLDVVTLVEAVLLWPIVSRAARVPTFGWPTWLWRTQEGSADDASRPLPVLVDASEAPDPQRPSDDRNGRRLFARRGRRAVARSADVGARRPNDPCFMRVALAWSDLRRAPAWRRIGPGWRLLVSGAGMVRPLREAETMLVWLGNGAGGAIFRELVTWPAGPWTAPRPLMSVLGIGESPTDDPRQTEAVDRIVDASVRAGIVLAQLEDPAVRRAIYAACTSVSVSALAQADPLAYRMFAAPTTVVIAALDAHEVAIAVIVAGLDREHAVIARLVAAPERPDGEAAFWILHRALTAVLARAGTRYLWANEPIGLNPSRQTFLSRLGYRCKRLRLAGGEG